MKRRNTLLVFGILIIFSFACNLPGAVIEVTSTPDVATQVAETVNAQMTQVSSKQPGQTTTGEPAVTSIYTPTWTAIPTSTSIPTRTTNPTPCNWAAFVSETYPDDTQVVAGTTFEKSWRLKNIGTCIWTSGYKLIFASGDAMGAPASKTMTNAAVAPGETVDVTVTLTAPTTEGTYKGNFRLQAPDGSTFGIGNSADGVFWVQIYSLAPTATTSSFMPVVTLVTLKPDLKITNITFTPAVVQEDTVTHVKVTVYNAGLVATHDSFTVKWWGLSTFANPSCTWVINSSLVAHGGVVKECDFTFKSYYPASKSKATADTEGTVNEMNEDNNTTLVDITVH